MDVHVLATTLEGTRCALAAAKELTGGSAARIVLLLPRLTTLGNPFNPASDERRLAIHRYRTLAATAGVEVAVLFCVCQRPDDAVRTMAGQSAMVIVGGRGHRPWPTREERLARRLTSQGYQVVLVQP